MTEVPQQIRRLLNSIGSVPYPFQHLEKEMTIGNYLCNEIPGIDNPGEVYAAINSVVDNFVELYRRIMGRLCQMASAVEEHCGLPMLPVPEPEESSQ